MSIEDYSRGLENRNENCWSDDPNNDYERGQRDRLNNEHFAKLNELDELEAEYNALEATIAQEHMQNTLDDIRQEISNSNRERRLIEQRVKDKEDKEINDIIANLNASLEKNEKVKAKLLEEKENNYSAREHYDLGILDYNNNKYFEAKSRFSKSIDKIPKFIDAYFQRAKTNIGLCLYDEALNDLTTSMKMKPIEHKYVCVRSEALYYKRDFKGAILDCKLAIKLDEACCFPYCILGIIKLEEGCFNCAVEYYEIALKIDQSALSKLYNIANHLHKNERFEEALKLYNLAVFMNPLNHNYICRRGNLKIDLKDFEGSIADNTKALELDPKCCESFNNRGLAKFNIKDYYGAISDYKEALNIDSTYEYSINNLKNINNLLEERKKAEEEKREKNKKFEEERKKSIEMKIQYDRKEESERNNQKITSGLALIIVIIIILSLLSVFI